MLSFIDKVTTAPNADVAGSASVGGLAARFAANAAVLDISDIVPFPDHDKPNPIWQLIKSKLRDLQKFSNILMEQQLLYLMGYYYLVCFLLLLSYTQKTYFL